MYGDMIVRNGISTFTVGVAFYICAGVIHEMFLFFLCIYENHKNQESVKQLIQDEKKISHFNAILKWPKLYIILFKLIIQEIKKENTENESN